MAVFNPQVDPTRDPNFFKYSDSISQPKADESKGIALKTISEGIEGGFKLADTVVKDVIKNDVYDQVDKERKDFSTALTNTRNFGNPAGATAPAGADPANTIAEGTPGGPVSLFEGQKTSVPSAINSGIRQAATVQAGLDGNKISQTTYYQRLDDIAVKMRTAYPGYRDYIDQQISHITGVTPANAYVDSIIQDINRQSTNANKEKEFWTHQIVNSGFPGNDEVLAQFERDGDHNRVARYLAYNNGVRSNLALKDAAFKDKSNDRKTQIERGEDLANSITTTAATSHFYNSQNFTNGDQSPADIADKMADLSLHPEKANDVAYQGLGERYAALHAQAYNHSMRLLTTPQKDPSTGQMSPAISDTIGITKAKEYVDKNIDALFGKTREFIADKQFSPAYSLQNAASATTNNALFKILTTTDGNGIGARITTAAALNKAAPNLTPVVTAKLLGTGLSTELGDFVKEQGRQAIAQTGGKYYGVDGKIYSMKQAMEELDQVKDQTGKEVPGQAYKNLVELRQAITDPTTSPEAINNAVKFFYDPKVNKGSMSKFMDDYYDPAKGGMVKGRTAAFTDLTSEDITSAIWKSGQGNWNKYSTWAKGEYAVQFGNASRDLNDVQKEGKFQFSWNSDKKEFNILNADGTPLHGLQATSVNLPYRTITNLNMGLRSMSVIAKTEGTNVDAYLFNILKQNGFTPDKDIQGVPAQIMRALIVGNGGKVKE